MILFYNTETNNQFLTLDADESRHCIRVLRKRIGDTVHVTNGQGLLCEAVVVNEDPKGCELEIIKRQTKEKRNPWTLHVAIAPTKNINRFEWFLEKATEIGIDRITPLFCDKSERRKLNTGRLQKVVVSAMKQSTSLFLPQIDEPIDFGSFIQQKLPEQGFIAYCSSEHRTLLKNAYKPGNNVLILIGPEGDFTGSEITEAMEKGYFPVSLGSTRLRTETAGVAACFTIELMNS